MLITLIVSIAFFCIWDSQAFWSGLVAGIVCIIANLVFILQTMRFRGASQAKQFIAAMMFGETAKLLILAVLTIIAVKYLNVLIVPYLISMIVNLLVLWLAPLVWIKIEY